MSASARTCTDDDNFVLVLLGSRARPSCTDYLRQTEYTSTRLDGEHDDSRLQEHDWVSSSKLCQWVLRGMQRGSGPISSDAADF